MSVRAVPFHKQDYWEQRFDHEDHFEWLMSWETLQHYIEPYLAAPQDPILHLGCGNSQLAFSLADHGHPHVINVDYAANVVHHMRRRTDPTQYPHIEWYHGDCLDTLEPLACDPPGYAVTIDKGLADAIACGDDEDQSQQQSLCQSVFAVTRPGGIWISVSFSGQRTFAWSDNPHASWTLEQKKPIQIEQPNDKAGAPPIYYWIYICRKNSPHE